jgi:hypothetical protein
LCALTDSERARLQDLTVGRPAAGLVVDRGFARDELVTLGLVTAVALGFGAFALRRRLSR